MVNGICRLCGNAGILEESHFIPSFVGKWAKRTSATGFMRSSEEINKRAQDLAKEHWLCGACENLFSKWEREFSLKLFYPFVEEGKSKANYSEWLAKFCASLSWRTLTYMRHKNQNDKKTQEQSLILDKAEAKLSDFILGRSDNLFEYEQHLFPLEPIESSTARLPKNINRYFQRAINMDIASSSSEMFIYTKIPSFMLLGFIKISESGKMRSSRVAIKGGTISPRKYHWPTGLMEYITEKANRITELQSEMSPRQKEKIEDFVKNNPDRVANSKTFKAFLSDYEIFGSDIFT